MATVAELGQKIKAKYPGQYDDLSDVDLGAKVKSKYPTDYADFEDTKPPRPSRKDSLKGGPANMPADADNPAREGFWKSLGNAVAAPFNVAANLDTITPKDILEGAGNTIVKAGSGNLLGAAGDVVGGALVGSALKGPPKALEAIEPSPLVPKAPSSGGVLGNMRGLYDMYKKIKKLSPTNLGEAGFEKFLDFVEGQAEQPAVPKPPGVPATAEPATPLPATGPYKPSNTAGNASSGAVSGSGNPRAVPSSAKGGPSVAAADTAPTSGKTSTASGREAPGSGKTGQGGEFQTLQDSTATRTKGITQAVKDAHAMRDTLEKWKFTPDEAKSMSEKSWAKLAYDSSVPMPSTIAARNLVIFELQKKMQGPGRSIDEMLAVFKK